MDIFRRRFPKPVLLAAIFACASAFTLLAVGKAPREDKQSRGQGSNAQAGVFLTNVPAHPFDLILSRITGESVTASVLTYQNLEGYFTWNADGVEKGDRTPPRLFKKDEPSEIVLQSLKPDTGYHYQFHSRASGADKFEVSPDYSFHTARPPGSTFTFTITADSHLDSNASAAVYQGTLASARADAPDFHIDLGDTFMTEKRKNYRDALPQYLAQRYYFGQLSSSAPLFLVLGNHDGESGGRLDGTADNMSVWSCITRKHYFPNPEPDTFYTGNTKPDPHAGLLQDYYAWEWGDALFVVLDPYWYTPRIRHGSDNWSRTLGREQYDWLAHTLAASKARFKFIFLHQLVGGVGSQGRGGSEAAPFCEWGGRNSDDSDGFTKNRPGWPMPIHQLLLQNHVTAVFHGHDHLFAKQELNGIMYQDVPQPAYTGNGHAPRSAAEYGYTHGLILGSPGYLRVTVSPQTATISLLRADDAAKPESKPQAGRIINTYTITR